MKGVLLLCAGVRGARYEGPKHAPPAGPTALDGVVYVSRHGVRTPYGPLDGSAAGAALPDDWSAWTTKAAKGPEAYGMSRAAFESQELTPHGKALMPLFGAYVREKWRAAGFDPVGCDITVFADDSTRDVQTAQLWLGGFGCAGREVRVGNASLRTMVPVLSDSVTFGPGAVATEEQTLGAFGGDLDALTLAYADDIGAIQDVLGMPPDAPICVYLGVDAARCRLLDLPFAYTGVYWQGMMTSPLYYAQFFAEAWMFESVSNPATGFGYPFEFFKNLYRRQIELVSHDSWTFRIRSPSSRRLEREPPKNRSGTLKLKVS